MKNSPPEKAVWFDSTWYVLIILMLIILVSLAGYDLIQQQKQFLLDEKRKEISTIADIKTAQIVRWRNERFDDASSIQENLMMAHRLNDFIVGKDKDRIHLEFKNWLSNLTERGGYNKGILFTPDGNVLISDSGLHAPPAESCLNLVVKAAKEHDLILSNFHSDTTGALLHIDLTIPIMHFDGTHSRCIAVLVLEIDPARRFFPRIQSWPTTSSTAETLLVKREGDSVLFLNELRHRTSTSSPFLLPLTNQDLPAARAVLGQEGRFTGVDYRNTDVLCATRVIPGTEWGLVAKIDIGEVLEPLSKLIVMVTFIGVMVTIAMILGVFLWSIRRKAEALNKQIDIEKRQYLLLKESENTLKKSRDYQIKLLNNVPSLIWRSGTDALCDYFNQTWLAFTGRTLEQELGTGWTAGVHPDDKQRCFDTYMEAFNSQKSFKTEYRLRNNDGSYHWINSHGCPYYDLNDIFAGYVGSCYDINVQKKAEYELHGIHMQLEVQIIERTCDLSEINTMLRQEIAERKHLEKELLSAKRLEAIGQIAGGVAHEVRNPLYAILTITEALFREEEIAANPELDQYIVHIRTQVTRLALLMNDLLDLGRTIPAANLLPVNLHEACTEALELWKSTGTSKNKSGILATSSYDISALVLADNFKLQQVFFNLLENAGHHTPEGSIIVISIQDYRDDLTDFMAVIQVTDQGTGIPEDKIPYVFDPFHTDRKGGTGLGLALVRHFIENMGGTVQLWNNEPPPGCTVEVRIPLYREESP